MKVKVRVRVTKEKEEEEEKEEREKEKYKLEKCNQINFLCVLSNLVSNETCSFTCVT